MTPWQYLIPSALIALIFRRLFNGFVLCATANLIGTILHELLHAVAAVVTGARVHNFSVVPRRESGRFVLGQCSLSGVRWWNAFVIGLAPLLIYPFVYGIAAWRTSVTHSVELLDLLIWIALAPCLLSGLPSTEDLKIAARSWPVFLGIIIMAYWVCKPM